MKFEQKFSMLFEDLNVPEVFITEYFCNANSDYVKIYLYCLFLCKYNCEISALDLSKKISIPLNIVEAGLKYWEEQGTIIKKNKTYEIVDLKKKEIDKLYNPKLTSSVEDAIEDTSKNVLRTQAINEINSTFFQGVMSPSWYTDIDNLFNKYNFDEDVMIALFRYCFDRQALHKKYLQTVAEGWASNKIHSMNDLENYYLAAEQTNKIKKTISKKLGIRRNLSTYEEAYIEKWTNDYNYPMDIIEIALKKTTSKTNFSFEYLDKLITDWHERNFNTPEEINSYIKEQKLKLKNEKKVENQISFQYFDNQTNQYDNAENFYTNL